MKKLEEAVEEDNKFADAYKALEALISIADDMPNLKEFFKEVYNAPKRETKLAEYQYRERAIDRVLFRDRNHPIDTVIINEFNQKTGNALEEVKIIYGAGADEYARSRHALALAVADRIYFRNGAYKPETEEGRKLLAHELTHIAQHKNREEYRNASKSELEREAEINELNEKYNPDPLIAKKIRGKEYRFRKSVWKRIVNGAVRGLELYIEGEEGRMPDSDYLELLLKYQEFMKYDMREWEA